MTLQEFRDSLSREEPPRNLNPALAALWWDAKNNWKQAHEVAGQDEGPAAAWVHAYLHRKEGDAGNARYWYKRADKTPATGTLEQEWREIAEDLLAGSEPSFER
jgi:hypothetical protein